MCISFCLMRPAVISSLWDYRHAEYQRVLDGLSRSYDSLDELFDSWASFLISAGCIHVDPKTRCISIATSSLPLKGMHTYAERMESDKVLKWLNHRDTACASDFVRDAQMLNTTFLTGALTADTQGAHDAGFSIPFDVKFSLTRARMISLPDGSTYVPVMVLPRASVTGFWGHLKVGGTAHFQGPDLIKFGKSALATMQEIDRRQILITDDSIRSTSFNHRKIPKNTYPEDISAGFWTLKIGGRELTGVSLHFDPTTWALEVLQFESTPIMSNSLQGYEMRPPSTHPHALVGLAPMAALQSVAQDSGAWAHIPLYHVEIPHDKTRADYPFVQDGEGGDFFDYQPHYGNVTPPMFHVMQRIGISAPLFVGLIEDTRRRVSDVVRAQTSEDQSAALLADILVWYPHVQMLKNQYIILVSDGKYEIHSQITSTSLRYFEVDLILLNKQTHQIMAIEVKSSAKQNSSQFIKHAHVFLSPGAQFCIGTTVYHHSTRRIYMLEWSKIYESNQGAGLGVQNADFCKEVIQFAKG